MTYGARIQTDRTRGTCVPPGKLRQANLAGFAASTPNQTFLSQSLTMRISGLRNQSKPGTYWASIVNGTFSWRGIRPDLYIVTKLHDWPAKKCHPSGLSS